MDPIGSVGRGWLMGPLNSVVSRSGGGDMHADESPSRRRRPGRAVDASVVGAAHSAVFPRVWVGQRDDDATDAAQPAWPDRSVKGHGFAAAARPLSGGP
jgi:hypothetical protein